MCRESGPLRGQRLVKVNAVLNNLRNALYFLGWLVAVLVVPAFASDEVALDVLVEETTAEYQVTATVPESVGYAYLSEIETSFLRKKPNGFFYKIHTLNGLCYLLPITTKKIIGPDVPDSGEISQLVQRTFVKPRLVSTYALPPGEYGIIFGYFYKGTKYFLADKRVLSVSEEVGFDPGVRSKTRGRIEPNHYPKINGMSVCLQDQQLDPNLGSIPSSGE